MSRKTWEASDIECRRARDEARHAYDIYAAESRHCGYEPIPFEKWTGETVEPFMTRQIA